MKSLSKVLLCILLISGVMTTSSAHAFFGMFEDGNISLVKESVLNLDQSTTIGNAFEGNQYLYDDEWISFEDAQKRTYVEYNGKINLMDMYAIVSTEYSKSHTEKELNDFLNAKKLLEELDIQLKVQFTVLGDSCKPVYAACYVDGEEYLNLDLNTLFTLIYRNQMPIFYYVSDVFSELVEYANLVENVEIGKIYNMPGADDREFVEKYMRAYNIDPREWDTSKIFIKVNSLSFKKINIDATFPAISSDGNALFSVSDYVIKNTSTGPKSMEYRTYDRNANPKLDLKINFGIPFSHVPIERKLGFNLTGYVGENNINYGVLSFFFSDDDNQKKSSEEKVQEVKTIIGKYTEPSMDPDHYGFVFLDENGKMYDLLTFDENLYNRIATDENIGKTYKVTYEAKEFYHEGSEGMAKGQFVTEIELVN